MSIRIALILILTSVVLCFADDVASRKNEVLRKYYEHYMDIDKQTSNRIRINWAFAALVLHDDTAVVKKADSVLFETIDPQKNGYTESGVEGHDMYWENVILSRLINSQLADKLSENTRQSIKALLWDFVKNFDAPSHANYKDINVIYNSDNHDMIHRGVYLMAAQALKNDPKWAGKKYHDGLTPAKHYDIWRKNLMEYFRFRASTGVNVEFGSNCYAAVYLQPIVNIYDYCEDKKLSAQAKKFLDLFFADAAQETLNGVRGGAKVRMYKNALSYDYLADKLLYYNYMLVGEPQGIDRLFPTDCFAMAQSDYELPGIIHSLMVDSEEKGSYAYKSNRLAQGDHTLGNEYGLGDSRAPIYTAQTQSGLLRYTYAMPSYVLGTFTVDETKTYMLINSQNQWMALTTAALPSSRIVVSLTPTSDNRTGYRELQAVQYENCAMFRKQLAADDTGLLRLFVSDDLEMTEGENSLFFENAVVYAAVLCRQMHGKTGYEIEGTNLGPGRFITYSEPNIYLLMQVVAKDKYENIDAFMVKVADDEFVFENNHDQIVYKNSSSGCTLEMFTNNRPPQINGEIVDLRPELVFDSPYLISEYGSAVITIKAPDGRKKVLDLNY